MIAMIDCTCTKMGNRRTVTREAPLDLARLVESCIEKLYPAQRIEIFAATLASVNYVSL